MKAVIFDFGFVLRRPSAYWLDRLAENGLEIGDVMPYFSGPGALENQFDGKPFGVEDMAPILRAALVPTQGDHAGRAAHAMLSVYNDKEAMEKIEGMDELMSELHRSGLKVGVLANGAAEIEGHLRDLMQSGNVDATVLAGRDGVAKPHKDAFELIAERLGQTLGDCFFIDDGEYNVAAARDAGMAAFHFRGDVADLRRALTDAGVLS